MIISPERHRNPGKGESSFPFTYLAVNMYWKELSLALPKLPPHYVWKVFMDTESEEGFLDSPVWPADRHRGQVAPRSIRILRAVPDMDSIARERNADRGAPPVGAVLCQGAVTR